MMLDRFVAKSIKKKGVENFFNDLHKLWQDGDAVILNCEGPFTDKHAEDIYKKYRFKFTPNLTNVLSKINVSHLLLANNHSFDQGYHGLKETLSLLRIENIKALGIDSNNFDLFKPVIVQKFNNKLAVLNYCDLNISDYSKFWLPLRIYQGDRALLLESVKQFSNANKVPLVVVLHWGIEFSLIPAEFQQKLARQLIDNGADLIIGHHPHVIQPSEMYKNRMIYYSIGNLIFDQPFTDSKRGKILEIKISENEIITIKEHKTEIFNYKPIIRQSK